MTVNPSTLPRPDPETGRKANLALAIIMLVLGILLAISFFWPPLEIMVIIGGALLMLLGLGAIMIVFVRQLPAQATWLGAAAVLLGAIIFVHDLMMPYPLNVITHGGAALLVVFLAIAGLVGRLNVAGRLQRDTA